MWRSGWRQGGKPGLQTSLRATTRRTDPRQGKYSDQIQGPEDVPTSHNRVADMSAPTTAQLARQWQGPALFSYGFRPFFLFGAPYAAMAVAARVLWYLGLIALPTEFRPIAGYAHELL